MIKVIITVLGILWAITPALFPSDMEHIGDSIKELADFQQASLPNTGGSDYTVLGDDFLHTEGDSICDGNHWRLDGDRAIATYASSTKIGSTFQFELIPTGFYAANIQFGRTRVYEISFGANSYEHLLVKNLQDNSNVGLYGVNNELRRGRLNMGFSLSSTTPNVNRVEEIVISENLLKLKITINGKVFETEEFQVNNNEKYDVIYFALIDTSEGEINMTGLSASELRICT